MAKEHVSSLSAWSTWLRSNPIAATYVRGANKSDPTGYFLRMHALTETILRRAMLVGLRRNAVRYSDALPWLHDNDSTPDRVNYERDFDALLGGNPTFAQLTAAGSILGELWELWLDFTKIVRNHTGHGIRTYSLDWVQLGTQIDQAFVIEYCRAVRPLVGGSLGDDLRKLSPRLGNGRPGTDISALMGRRSRRPRPTVSLTVAEARFKALGLT